MGIGSATVRSLDVTHPPISHSSLPKARGKGNDEKPPAGDGDKVESGFYGKLTKWGKPWGGIGPLIMTPFAVFGGSVGVLGTYLCYENSKKSIALSKRSLAISEINLKEDQNKNRGRITSLTPPPNEDFSSFNPNDHQAMTVYSPRESLSTMQATA